MNLVARLIAGGLPTRIYYIGQGGYDTHSNQAGAHDRLMGEMDSALAAFAADLKAQGNFGRVILMTFSEFGRRVAENGSGGPTTALPPRFLWPVARSKPASTEPCRASRNCPAGTSCTMWISEASMQRCSRIGSMCLWSRFCTARSRRTGLSEPGDQGTLSELAIFSAAAIPLVSSMSATNQNSAIFPSSSAAHPMPTRTFSSSCLSTAVPVK